MHLKAERNAPRVLSTSLQELEEFMRTAVSKDPTLARTISPISFFLLVFLDREAAEARAAVKHWGDIMRGVTTQCIRLSKIEKFSAQDLSQIKSGPSQYYNNVLLK